MRKDAGMMLKDDGMMPMMPKDAWIQTSVEMARVPLPFVGKGWKGWKWQVGVTTRMPFDSFLS